MYLHFKPCVYRCPYLLFLTSEDFKKKTTTKVITMYMHLYSSFHFHYLVTKIIKSFHTKFKHTHTHTHTHNKYYLHGAMLYIYVSTITIERKVPVCHQMPSSFQQNFPLPKFSGCKETSPLKITMVTNNIM